MSAKATEPNWITGDSREIDRHVPPDQQVDLIFSCPPYADLEVYSDDPADISSMGYQEFLEAYREIIAKACARLRDNRFAVWVVGEVRTKKGGGHYHNFVGDTIKAFEDAGLRYYNEAVLITATGSLALRAGHIFRASRKLGKGHQNMLVFAKGEPTRTDPIKGMSDHLAQLFEGHRRLLEAHEKVLVFAKGDPHQASDDLGAPLVGEPEWMTEAGNE